MKSKSNAVLFLDRDGTVNVDKIGDYINTVEETFLISGSGRAIIAAKEAGFLISIITNQAGVAKGVTRAEELPRIHKKLEKLIAEEAGIKAFHFDDIEVCLHHPDKACSCRKPETTMLDRSMEKLKADPARSFFVGDKTSDLLCGKRRSIRAILVRTGHGADTERRLKEGTASHQVKPEIIVDDLKAAVDYILGRRQS